MKISNYKILNLYTIQEYGISNFFKWFHTGSQSKNMIDGQKNPKYFNTINKSFVEFVENKGVGSSLFITCKPI